ncbi:response regulator transcription factor [Paracoccaceae bacterium Fryx2]|nr:response regulator transcription factor [Paracoccaceae bacterium Fryx2]
MEHRNISPLGPRDRGDNTVKVHAVVQNATKSATLTMVVVDSRNLEREAFVRYVSMTHKERGIEIVGRSSVEEWFSLGGSSDRERATILLNIGTQEPTNPACAASIRAAVERAKPTPVVILGASEDIREMIAAFDCGAQGYMPTSVGIDDIVEAARLTATGGIFLPKASIIALRDLFGERPDQHRKSLSEENFTNRQIDICDALRCGKSNKVIAYDLNLCESTVKVHIRNIMKKLKATNRTEAAFKLNRLYFGAPDHHWAPLLIRHSRLSYGVTH